MFKKILPKEEKYFDDFNAMISLIDEMAIITHQLFFAEQMDYALILKLKSLEKRCDEISSRVTKRLNKTYITPFDREDIFALIKKLDNIAGTLVGGWKVIKTLGMRMTKLNPFGGFSAETSSGLTIISATLMGIPVSTTHTITGSITGVGAIRGFSAVRWGVAKNILWAWILTIPLSALFAMITYAIMSWFFI